MYFATYSNSVPFFACSSLALGKVCTYIDGFRTLAWLSLFQVSSCSCLLVYSVGSRNRVMFVFMFVLLCLSQFCALVCVVVCSILCRVSVFACFLSICLSTVFCIVLVWYFVELIFPHLRLFSLWFIVCSIYLVSLCLFTLMFAYISCLFTYHVMRFLLTFLYAFWIFVFCIFKQKLHINKILDRYIDR